jgi:hypothetical protein
MSEIETIIELEPATLIESRRDVPDALDGRWDRHKVRDPGSVDTLGVHHTAVAGGFGVGSKLLARHDGDELAARMERYSGQPYHAIFSPQDQASVIQWPGWMHTWHGNGMNRYTVGWGLDLNCVNDRDYVAGPENIERMILAGLHVVNYYRAHGFDLKYIETHRQHSRKSLDPCDWIVRKVLIPLSLKANMELRAEAKSGHGRALDRAQIDSWIEEKR